MLDIFTGIQMQHILSKRERGFDGPGKCGIKNRQGHHYHCIGDTEEETQKSQTCISQCYLSLECWKHFDLHFEDACDEQFFLDENYFRSKMHIRFSCAFAVLQISAFFFFMVEILFKQFDDNPGLVAASAVLDNVPIMIGSGVDGLLILIIQLVEVCCLWKGRRSAKCSQMWHIARMTISCIAAIVFYLGASLTAMTDLYLYDLDVQVGKSIGNASYHCAKLYKLDPYGTTWSKLSYGSAWSPSAVNDWICVFFAEEWQFTDFIYMCAGPQTIFLHALPARVTLPILAFELAATPILFFLPTWKNGTRYFPIYIWYYQVCFALGLTLKTLTAERESRRNFKARDNWRYLQNNLLYRLRESDRLERVMMEDCPKELEWFRLVGDGDGHVPLHAENIHSRIQVSADTILNSGNFRRAMHGKDLEYLRIPANEITECDFKLGRGGQGKVVKGRWKQQDVAIKKWGSLKTATHLEHIEKYTHEVNVLTKLHHR